MVPAFWTAAATNVVVTRIRFWTATSTLYNYQDSRGTRIIEKLVTPHEEAMTGRSAEKVPRSSSWEWPQQLQRLLS